MISFFRKIRAALLAEGKTGKPAFTAGRYLKYSVGEILLIVIGILLAMQLNNLNEVSKNKELEKNYLHGIIENLDQDIESLNGHVLVQRYKLNVYTILVRAFTDKYISSDKHLLKHAALEAHGYYDFDPQRNVFDGMSSAGLINLIQSPDLRNMIQAYYVQTTAVVNGEILRNEEIMYHQRQIFSTMINFNSLSETGFEPKWQASLVDDDLLFFDRDINDGEVKEFANRVSDIKQNTAEIIGREIDLQNRAKTLKTKILEYLAEAEDVKSDDLSEDSVNDYFTPSIPQNAITITDDQLSKYTGTFELVKRNGTTGPFSERDRIQIKLENNHLVYQSGLTSHSFYCIKKDEFQPAISFLFDDPISETLMKFTITDDNKIIDVVIHDFWNGVSEYKKIE